MRVAAQYLFHPATREVSTARVVLDQRWQIRLVLEDEQGMHQCGPLGGVVDPDRLVHHRAPRHDDRHGGVEKGVVQRGELVGFGCRNLPEIALDFRRELRVVERLL